MDRTKSGPNGPGVWTESGSNLWTKKGHAKTFEERITGLKKTTTYENDIRQKEKQLAEQIQKEKVKISVQK